jgi:hypothetical protein
MGAVEDGVRETLRQEGIKEPSTALELLAIQIAKTLDSSPEDKVIAGLSRELRLTLEAVHYQPRNTKSFLDDLQARQ